MLNGGQEKEAQTQAADKARRREEEEEAAQHRQARLQQARHSFAAASQRKAAMQVEHTSNAPDPARCTPQTEFNALSLSLNAAR